MGEVIRVATYNIHKSRGLDARTRPERILEVLHELDADIIALQEVLHTHPANPARDQATFFAHGLPNYKLRFGETRKHRGAAYGNAVLTRLKVRDAEHYDLTSARREPRGCLRVELESHTGRRFQFFNAHLGTGFVERRWQAHQIVEILSRPRYVGCRMVLGDFNEWTRGLVTQFLSAHLESCDFRKLGRKRARSYPGVLPFMHLDHIYYDNFVNVRSLGIHRTRMSLIASDHLPLLAEFEIKN
jgi:endonuclease/exonuclease/phosphatase family metal-dependent hydrolase